MEAAGAQQPPKTGIVVGPKRLTLDADSVATLATRGAALPCVQSTPFWRFAINQGLELQQEHEIQQQREQQRQEQQQNHKKEEEEGEDENDHNDTLDDELRESMSSTCEAEWRFEVPQRVFERALADAIEKGTARFFLKDEKNENDPLARIDGWAIVHDAQDHPSIWHELRQHYYRPTVDKETGEASGHYLYTSHRIDLRMATYMEDLFDRDTTIMAGGPENWLVLGDVIGASPATRLALIRAAVVEAKMRRRRILARCYGSIDFIDTLEKAGFVLHAEVIHRHLPFNTMYLVAAPTLEAQEP
ncbi:Hypothetical Protein FCC1311_011532 [Hondaea fermentalgiana]|uniref:Uncharacterized protein n=1 Tax=Hondaea fermentalgiana TaxID=2315210 RepID=A0A2R5G1N6_9STRA|nr:Hypothetical Protein FCC1311_011532 [Hondaea fermentalgiana]|eukprot:GBG24936.1 Hypothetical Protein FCC1311_011532 [Hondaea fermentalgiana]